MQRRIPQQLIQHWQWIPLLVLSLLSTLSILLLPVIIYDEGLVVAGAERILRGELPYRDFWSIYPPGQFFTLAALFALFEPSLLTARSYDLAIKVAISIVSFLVIRRITGSSAAAWVGWLLSTLWIGFHGAQLYPIFPAVLLMLSAGYCMSRFFEKSEAKWLHSTTALLISASLFRHDMGIPALLAELVILTLYLRSQQEGYSLLKNSALSIFASAALLLLLMWPLANPLTLFQQLITTPAWLIPEYRWLPYPAALSRDGLPFIVIPAIIIIALLINLYWWYKKVPQRFALLWLILLACCCINQVRVRSDSHHLLALALITLPILPILFTQLVKGLKPSLRWTGSAMAIVLLGYALWPQLQYYGSSMKYVFSNPWPEKQLEKAGYAYLAPAQLQTVKFIQHYTQPDEKIYLGVNNHDRFLLNNVMLYFVSGRGYASRYHELHPGITTTAEVQQQIIQELREQKIRMVILSLNTSREPNSSSQDKNLNLLDNYIRQHYRSVQRYQEYEIWWLKETQG